MNVGQQNQQAEERFEVEARSRCYTWPTQPQPQQQQQQQQQYEESQTFMGFDPLQTPTPYQQQQPFFGGGGTDGQGQQQQRQVLPSINFLRSPIHSTSNLSTSSAAVGLSPPHEEQQAATKHLMEPSSSSPPTSTTQPQPQPEKKKRVRKRNPSTAAQKKPNPWGEESYSDLIARALTCAPGGRLKLNEVYQWFSENIPYFADRSSQEEAQGWKNSIRHNLSLHSRFMRIQNEGAGKSSWWVINPDAKAGRSPRRRAATMETSTKTVIDKKRRGARKRVEIAGAGARGGAPIQSAGTSLMGSQASLSQDIYNECEDTLGPNFETFRGRTQSTLSNVGTSSRVSPTLEPPGFEDFDFPPWMDAATGSGGSGGGGASTTTGMRAGIPPVPHQRQLPQPQQTMGDILDRTDQIRIIEAAAATTDDTVPSFQQRTILSNSVKLEMLDPMPGQSTLGGFTPSSQLKQQPMPMSMIKSEFASPSTANSMDTKSGIRQIQPPPSYQELGSVRGSTPLQNLLQRGVPPPRPGAPYYQQAGSEIYGQPPPSTMMGGGIPQRAPNLNSNSTWAMGAQPQFPPPSQQHQLQQPMEIGDGGGGGGGRLPLDLENLTTMDESLMNLDMDAVLRHDLALTGDNQLHFDLP